MSASEKNIRAHDLGQGMNIMRPYVWRAANVEHESKIRAIMSASEQRPLARKMPADIFLSEKRSEKQMPGKEIEVYGKGGEDFRFQPYEHRARYYETDQMGIIHHSNYIKWMEEARMDMLDQIGLSYKQMEEMEIISPVLSVSCEYHSMVHFDDTVVIETRITRYNGVKMDFEYRMTDRETGELRTTAKSSHCFLNRSGRPISLKRSYPEIDTKFFEFSDKQKS